MAKDKKTYQKWIDAAYLEFALNGPEFSIKELAKKTLLPRSTLYYHFDSKENLIQELLKQHSLYAESYILEMKSNVKVLIPDLYEHMFRYKNGILFHQQLLKNSHVESYYKVYFEANEKSLKFLLPLIKQHFGSEKSNNEMVRFYHTLTDAWYTRLNPNNFSVDSMIHLAVEIMENTLGLYKA